MQIKKKISVITINLNNKEGLERTIKSVISQTFFEKVEYVVVDGASNDGSIDIIDKYKDKFSSITIEKDKGIYNAMNKGIDKANGEYVIFLNSGDEFYDIFSIEKCYGELNKDIIYGNLLVKDEQKKYIKSPFIKKYPDVITAQYMAVDSVPHNGSFIRLKLLKEEKYNEDFKIVSDWAFFFKKMLLDKCTYKHIDVIVSKFYLGGASSDEKQIRKEKTKYLNSLKYNCKVGVVIPCYNQGRYIADTISSLKNQTFKDWKCIIVNDGSTDNSEEVILREIYGDDRFIYRKQNNRGLGYSRNVGIRSLNSEYIFCLDSDDIINEKYFELGVDFLDKNLDYSVFYGNAKFLYNDGKTKTWNLPEYTYEKLLHRNMIYCSFLYRRSDYEKTNGYDEFMRGYEDWEFLIRLLSTGGKVYRSDSILFFYRQHGESMDKVYNRGLNRTKMIIYMHIKNEKIYDKYGITMKELLELYNKKGDNTTQMKPETENKYKEENNNIE